jgi:hypothetical protein
LLVHFTHSPSSHLAAAAVEQSVDSRQATHVFAVVSHFFFAFVAQSPSSRHSTQVSVGSSQIGFGTVQAPLHGCVTTPPAPASPPPFAPAPPILGEPPPAELPPAAAPLAPLLDVPPLPAFPPFEEPEVPAFAAPPPAAQVEVFEQSSIVLVHACVTASGSKVEKQTSANPKRCMINSS